MDVRGTAIAVARAQRQQALAIAARMRYLSRRRPVPLAGRSQKVEKMRTFVAALICSLCAAVAGCSAIGELDIKRVTPDGPSGYLKRPLQLTVSTQDSLLHFAHGICQDVMPGSSAQITFVRKVTGLNDWEIYRYDCEGHLKGLPREGGAVMSERLRDQALATPDVGQEYITGDRWEVIAKDDGAM